MGTQQLIGSIVVKSASKRRRRVFGDKERPRCAFCSQPSSNWKVGKFWTCSVCGVNLQIMKMDHLLENTMTEQYGGPVPTNRKVTLFAK